MSDNLNETIQDIAIRHGVLLGRDDPILIFQTMNDRLIEENRKAQQEMLTQFKEEMENISSQWKDDAKEKAEKILNAALAGAKEATAKLLQEALNESVQTMKKMMSDSLTEVYDLTGQTRKFSGFALLSSAAIFITSCLFLLMLWIK